MGDPGKVYIFSDLLFYFKSGKSKPASPGLVQIFYRFASCNNKAIMFLAFSLYSHYYGIDLCSQNSKAESM